MRRVVFLGRGAAGKSTAALALGERTGLPVIELDRHFWRPGLIATPAAEWSRRQAELIAGPRWIVDGDLGPHDDLPVRLAVADTVVILDFGLLLCGWRAVRRSRERADFWWWLICWRRRSRPVALEAVARHAPGADVHVLRTPRALAGLLATADPLDIVPVTDGTAAAG